eukprot:524825-Pelagomonas_calceolata.AAC.5
MSCLAPACTGGSRLALGSGEGGAIDLTTTSSSISQQKQRGRQSRRVSVCLLMQAPNILFVDSTAALGPLVHAHLFNTSSISYCHQSSSWPAQADSDDEDPMAKFGPMPEAGDFATGPAEDDNEAGPSAAPGMDDSAWMMGQQQQQFSNEGVYDYSQYGALQQHGPAPEQYEAGAYYVGAQPEYAGYPSASLPSQLAAQGEEDPGQALFAQALMEEQERAAKKGKVGVRGECCSTQVALALFACTAEVLMGIDLSGIQFKEVNQKDLTYVPAAAREAATNVRSALGPEYAGHSVGRRPAIPWNAEMMGCSSQGIARAVEDVRLAESIGVQSDMPSAFFPRTSVPGPATHQTADVKQYLHGSVPSLPFQQTIKGTSSTYKVPISPATARTLRFPSSRKYLWDRTACAATQYLQPKDYVPAVEVHPSVLALAQQQQQHGMRGGRTMQLHASIAASSDGRALRLILKTPSVGASNGPGAYRRRSR